MSALWLGLVAGTAPAHAQAGATPAPAPVAVDLSAYDAAASATATVEGARLRLAWPAGEQRAAEIVFDLDPAPNRPLFERLALGGKTILRRVEPVAFLTIGERDVRAPAGWVAFFDNPPQRAYRTVPATLKKTAARVSTVGARTVVRIGDVTAGSFRGALEISVFRNSPLVFVETVVSTEEDGRAILYDAGLAAPGSNAGPTAWADAASGTYSPLVPGPGWQTFAWLDPEGKLQRAPAALNQIAGPLHVSRRTIVAESTGGAVAAFPPPHQYFYPLDSANNLGFVWYGAGRNPLLNGYGFGIRQPPEGDRIWVPWVNAPPKTEQRLGIFYLLAADATQAFAGAGRFTRDDRFARLPGHRTFSSHYHIEHTLEFVRAQREQAVTGVPRGLEAPGFVKTFKARGVDIVHLGEFHVGSFPRMAAKERLALLKTLHEECARLSDTELLVLPGEEPNVHLGGHWMSFFPRPVYWVLNRGRDEPFVEDVPGYGQVYRVGSAADVLELMQRENGLMWTAHPRIKGSRGFPDQYWDTPFFRSDRFLGAAWKAMPADLSQPRLGTRVLDLLDDMANAGRRKYALAEADLFRMEPDYESYGHLNINYLRLDALPRFGDGWQPVLDALRGGKFFSSTGEVLIPEFTVDGKPSGETLARPSSQRDGRPLAVSGAGTTAAGERPLTIAATIEGTFPLAFAEVISGDGRTVRRERIDLTSTESFAQRTLTFSLAAPAARWVRLEVWDVARNGAFTPPVWIE